MAKPAEPLPRFRTEAQERAFWETEGRDSNQHLDWAKAQRLVLPNLKLSTKTISLRLPQHLPDAIKAAANARDVPYQSLIKVWLQEKVGRVTFRHRRSMPSRSWAANATAAYSENPSRTTVKGFGPISCRSAAVHPTCRAPPMIAA
jgi:predicted DNA binding CopG/RHH family protein